MCKFIQLDTRLTLRAEYHEAALADLKETCFDHLCPQGRADRAEIEACTTLSELLEYFGMNVYWGEGNHGDITHVKAWDEEGEDYVEVFEALSPFIEAGSFIVYNNGGITYRLFFDGKRMHDQEVVISFPELGKEGV